MKLQRSTVILAASALLLGGIVLITETRQSQRPTVSQEAEASPVYPFEEGDVVGLQIETPGQAVTFERDDAGAWQMIQPEAHPAEEAAIAFLLSRLTTDGLVQTITLDAAKQADFGLDIPLATVDITLADGTTHTLALGNTDFSGQSHYALIDPEKIPLSEEAGEVPAAIVAMDVRNGVDRPLEEWKAVVETADETEVDNTEDVETDTDETDAETDSDRDTNTSDTQLDGADADSDTDTDAGNTEPDETDPGSDTDTDASDPPLTDTE